MTIDTDISVALATYNGDFYLRKQIESIIAQSVHPLEIVIVDDCSTDSTVDQLMSLQRESPIPLRVVVNDTNLGHADNFLKVASLTRTKYIAFCDQDDLWHPDKLKTTLEVIRNDNSLMVVHNAALIDENDVVIGHMKQCGKNQLVPSCKLDPWIIFWGLTQTVDRKILELLPFDKNCRGQDTNNPNLTLGHDGWTSFIASTFGAISMINADLVYYRQHSKNVYGYAERSFLQKILFKISEEQSRVDRITWLSEIAQHRLSIIQKTGQGRVEYTGAIQRWQKITDQCNARRDLAHAKGFWKKIFLLYKCWDESAYKPVQSGGLGAKRLLEDVIMGVLNISLRKRNH